MPRSCNIRFYLVYIDGIYLSVIVVKLLFSYVYVI